MQFYIKQNESTAARKRIPIYLVDATNGYTPETGLTAPTVELSKNGGAQFGGGGSFAEIGDGAYYYEVATGEHDTLGWLHLRCVESGVSRDYNAIVHITAYDAYDVNRLGLQDISPASGISYAVWSESMSQYSNIANSFGSGVNKLLNNNDDIYFADIKFINDDINNRDEYSVYWYKNSTPLGYNLVASPAISIYNTNNGSAVITDKVLTYFNANNGVLRYDETTTLLASGEPYIAIASGTIDSQTRIWTNIIGINLI